MAASGLIVDDDLDTFRKLADILSDQGYRADTASDGLAALELVRKNPYDVALLEFRMTGVDGLERYRKSRKLRADMVAIIILAKSCYYRHIYIILSTDYLW